jgi:DNA topoisomerase I
MAKRPAKSKARPAAAQASPPGGDGATATAPPKASGRRPGRRQATTAYKPGAGKDRHLVIVESPSKAKTINKYLGRDYLVLASVGHVRDLPSRNPKGVKSPVPGVDLERDFTPTYAISDGKERVIADLKRAAKEARSTGCDVWFATDLDREGEAIAWHLAQELEIPPAQAKRVVFPAITKAEIERAFKNPHPINEDRVNAQQARRILDRIVGYQVSPLLWKKVARGLSAGRVQSVAVRLIVEREREIRAFVPQEYWAVSAAFTSELAQAPGIARAFAEYLTKRDEKGNAPSQKLQGAFLGERATFRAELVEVAGEKFDLRSDADASSARSQGDDLQKRALRVARLAGLTNLKEAVREEASGKGPAAFVRTITGDLDPAATYRVQSIESRRTSTRPPAPFITSTLQQAGATRLGFAALRTMRAAQQLYEGVDIPGEGPTGLITYMRTDSTHLSGDALTMVRDFIGRKYGKNYLPEKPNVYTSSNKDAQEAHEAIRPTSLDFPPARIKSALTPDQFRLYSLIWDRFVACQMVPAQWDAAALTIVGGTDPASPCTFRATGRTLAFDGFYRASGVPQSAEEQTLPRLETSTPVAPVVIDPAQKFTSPPPRYSEASLIKVLESEGIGRPSTYASIISTIQDRNYVEKESGRFFATDLGEVVTDKLLEAIPDIMDVGYTRDMESLLDKVEDDHLDWVDMLRKFYGPFKKQLAAAEKDLVHAKAETTPAPAEYTCPTCAQEGRGRAVGLVYRFGKNGRFLSCSLYPECKYASPVDREGKPRPAAQAVDVACPKCGSAMTKRVGRFGPFLGCSRYGDKAAPCDGILNLDRKGRVVAPSTPPLTTPLMCPLCQDRPLYLRGGARGPWLSCSGFPKCRGRGKWAELPPEQRADLEKQLAAHEKANPVPVIRTMSGKALTDAKGKPLPTAGVVGAGGDDEGATLEEVADEMGV